MSTSDEILSAWVASAKTTAEQGLEGFRQNDSSAQMISGRNYAAMLHALADEEVQRAINNSSGTVITKFRPICS